MAGRRRADRAADVVERADSTEDAVLAHLEKTNRPFTSDALYAALAPENVTKPGMERILESLCQEGRANRKETKTKKAIFFAAHDNENIREEEIAEMKERTEDAEKEAAQRRERLKTLSATYKGLASAMGTKELNRRIEELEGELAAKTAELEEKKRGGEVKDADERKKKEQQLLATEREERKRKRLCIDMIDQFLEGVEMSKKEFVEETGIEM